jgi:hypothetical protein
MSRCSHWNNHRLEKVGNDGRRQNWRKKDARFAVVGCPGSDRCRRRRLSDFSFALMQSKARPEAGLFFERRANFDAANQS